MKGLFGGHPSPEGDLNFMKMIHRSLVDGVDLIAVATNKFKTSMLSVTFAVPLRAESATAYAVACKVESLAQQPSNALGATMATFAGQNLGARNYSRIRTGSRCAMALGVLFTLLSVLINIGLGKALMGLFFVGEMSQQVQSYAMEYLWITTLFFPFLIAIHIFRSMLQGLGEKVAPMMGGVVELIARVGVCAVLPGIMGYTGACLAPCAAWLGAGLLTTIRYLYVERRWRRQGLMKEGETA